MPAAVRYPRSFFERTNRLTDTEWVRLTHDVHLAQELAGRMETLCEDLYDPWVEPEKEEDGLEHVLLRAVAELERLEAANARARAHFAAVGDAVALPLRLPTGDRAWRDRVNGFLWDGLARLDVLVFEGLWQAIRKDRRLAVVTPKINSVWEVWENLHIAYEIVKRHLDHPKLEKMLRNARSKVMTHLDRLIDAEVAEVT